MVLRRIPADFLECLKMCPQKVRRKKRIVVQWIDYQYKNDQISKLDFLDFLEFLEFVDFSTFSKFSKDSNLLL